MKECDDNLLLFLDNLKITLYQFVWADNTKDYEFYKCDITERVNHIFSYKKQLLKNYENFKKHKEGKKNESESGNDC